MRALSTPQFNNSYACLPGQFYTRHLPVPVVNPGLIRANDELAITLGIDPGWLVSETGVNFAVGNQIPEGADPIATVYAGHQFGAWNPQLGDGRAILLGEVVAASGRRYDIQLKGSGRTPYSRGGDGRAPLGPVLREYVVSEAMSTLGVPTSRALAAATTGEVVMRESPLPGAVLVRVAQSHIRIGSIQFFSAQKDFDSVRILVNHIIQRHFPQLAETNKPVHAMLDEVVERQASLIAQWQSLGFIHGVMNTDNMLLSGETIDYGPCAYMDEYDPATVFSSIDHGGRYAYRNQPHIAHWNLAMLAQALLPLLDDQEDKAIASGQTAIDRFPDLYMAAYLDRMRQKLGLNGRHTDDEKLIRDLLTLMHESNSDFTLTFRRLSDLADPDSTANAGVAGIFELPESFDTWLERWQNRLQTSSMSDGERQANMYASNPAFIARNHLLEEVIEAATRQGDLKPFHRLVDLLEKPFEFDASLSRYAMPPRPEQIVRQTFCGT